MSKEDTFLNEIEGLMEQITETFLFMLAMIACGAGVVTLVVTVPIWIIPYLIYKRLKVDY